jgi:pimeloyl-ACP methyl ester carboxylesterase
MIRFYAFILLALLSGSALAQCKQPKESYVDVEKVRVRYVEAGSGPVVVMIHGNAGSVDDWDFRSMGELCHDHRLLAIDRPGHGKSDRPDGKAATLDNQARLVHQALVQLGITRPVMVGHSWGGSLALAYAVDYPNELSGIVLLAPAAYPDEGGDEFLRALLKTPVIGDISLTVGRILFGKRILKKELNKAFYPDTVPAAYLRYASSSWLHHKQVRATLEDEWGLNKELEKTSRHYADIRIPVVIVTGDQDKVVKAKDNAYRLKTTIVQSQLIELKNTGHQVPQTHPEIIYNAIILTSKTAARSTESIP